ncbi:hypothetical protein TIFTF001_039470 [Ficus carica]|uniref:EF-hand domain-containing protein n=1 Tax=Ficus carica TaxID=3494 RepID=A0AA88EF77_FICCA|nr:hypothetical protein TIFTF001_039468 [Ficus carica]GMN70427.1 hypothetical protein TIFTF001_039470 [Ficus carica]
MDSEEKTGICETCTSNIINIATCAKTCTRETPHSKWLFDEIDEDRDNFISPSEVKELFLEIEFKAVEANKEQAIAEVMTKFDIDGDRKITKDEFVDGLTKWLDEVKYAVDRQIYSPRSLKDINQVFQPWVQNKRREREIKRTIMLDIQENFLRIGHGRLLTENGKPNLPNIRRLFEQFDRDGDNFISERELRALILDIRFGKISMEVLNEAAKGLMQELDTSGDNLISEQEFVKGLEKWLINTTPIQASKSSVGSEDEIYPKSGEETDKLEEEAESKGIVVENSPQAWMKAIMYLVIGIITLSVLAEPLIESVQKFSESAGIPSFFISFILVPLATTARAATSAISTASHKTPITTSLTFSEIYGGVFMNNILGFSVLLSLIYFREMTWEFSAEVLVVLIVCFVVGLVASFRFTFALWTASIAYMLYPVSLLLVYVFNNVLQYV